MVVVKAQDMVMGNAYKEIVTLTKQILLVSMANPQFVSKLCKYEYKCSVRVDVLVI